MFRDFSESAKAKLFSYIEEVTETTTWGKIGDAISDAGMHVQHWLGFLNISRYVDDLDTYHKKVLDKNDTTKSQIEEIFASVNRIDERYEKGFSGELTTSEKIVQFIEHLSETMNPNGGNLDMRKMSAVLESDIEEIQESRVLTQSAIENNMLGTNPEGASTSVDPVNLSTGNFIYEHEDIRINADIPLSFHRFYNSKDATKTVLGKGFRHNYDITLEEFDNKVDITMSDGQHKYFEASADSSYIGTNTIAETLQKSKNGYRYVLENGTQIIFSLDGKMTRMEDSNFRGINFSYLDNGMLSKAVTDNGDFLVYTYTSEGFLENVLDQTGREVTLCYENRYLKEVHMPEKITLRYHYAPNGRVSEVVNSQEVVSVYNKYDDRFRVIQQRFPDGGEMYFSYDDDLKQVTQIERNGCKTIYVHDDRYRNTDIIYSDGTKEKFVYNDRNQCVYKTDRKGNITRMAYDNRGNMTQVVDSGKRKANMTYDSNNKLISLRINGKLKLKNSYDKNGNLICTEDAIGNKIQMYYNENGKIIKKIVGKEVYDYLYDSKGNLYSIKNESGEMESYTYDTLNRVISCKDANNNIERYIYDESDRIIETVNARGDKRIYTYNSNGKPTKIIDYDGYPVYMEYDSSGRLVCETDKEGNRTQYSYDKMWNVESFITPNGGIEKYEYDLNNKLVRIVLPQSGEINYSYDSVGNITSVKDPEGNITKFEYNSVNMLICVIEANGAITRYEYDSDGNLEHIYDALGNVISLTYDEVGNKTSYTDERGFTTKIEYTLNNKVKRIIYPNGGITEYNYDRNGRLKSYKEPDGFSEEYTYDKVGNLIRRKNNLGETYIFEYDCMNQVVKTINPMGGEKEYTYDKIGNMTSVKDENGNITIYKYSPNGNLLKVIGADSTETLYEYDSMGNVTKISRDDGESAQETKFEWDLLGNIKKITNPLGDVEEYLYNKCGQLLKKNDQDGYETKYHYDSVGELDEIVYADNRKVSFSYNLLKQLEIINDWMGTTTIKVDETGMPLSITDTYGEVVQYEWGSMQEKRKLIYPNGESVSYVYNNANQLVEIHNGNEKTEYVYDDMGRFTSRCMPNGLRMEYSYTEFGRIKQINNWKNQELLESYQYQYDLAGNKIQTIKQRKNVPDDNGIYDYQYDCQNRIKLVTKDGVKQRRYKYDAFGNRTEKQDYMHAITTRYAYNMNNQLIHENDGYSSKKYEYDHRGNIQRVTENDRVVEEYVFDSANRMSQVEKISKLGETKKISYYYNGFGNRIGSKKIYNENIKEMHYTLDMTRKCHNLLRQTDNQKMHQTYYYDGKVMGAKSNDYISYYLSDDHGSPTLYVGNNIINHYSYDEFGVSLDNDFSEQPFGYTGYLYEADGLYYAQACILQPQSVTKCKAKM